MQVSIVPALAGLIDSPTARGARPMEHSRPIPLEGWRLLAPPAAAFVLPEAEVRVDDEDWGRMPVADAQARLEAAGDFAIVVLGTGFRSRGAPSGLIVEAPSEGQRNLLFDRTYLVPVKSGAPPGRLRYRCPEPLPDGEHRMVLSYAWEPPSPAVEPSGSSGVHLAAPAILGGFVVLEGELVPPPADLDLRHPTSVAVVRDLEVPAWARKLLVEGPQRGQLRLRLDDTELVPVGDVPFLCPLPPGLAGPARLVLEPGPLGVFAIRGARFLP